MLTKHQENHLLVFISWFTTSVTPSINTPESSNEFIMLIKLSILSFKMGKVYPFPDPVNPFPLILLSNLLIPFEAALKAILLTNQGKLLLAKVITRSVTTFFT